MATCAQRQRKHIAGGQSSSRVPSASSQTAAGRSRRALRSGRSVRAPVSCTRIVSPRPAARASQSARMAAKPSPRCHCANPCAASRADSAANRALRRDHRAGATQIGRREMTCRRGWLAQLTPKPMTTVEHRLALAFDQDAGELVQPQQHIVRPFELEQRPEPRRAVAQGIVQRQRRHERQLRRQRLGRRLAQQQRGVEIARRRDPRAAAPAAPGALALRGDPQRPALAGARTRQRLGIGGADGSRKLCAGPPPGPWLRGSSCCTRS